MGFSFSKLLKPIIGGEDQQRGAEIVGSRYNEISQDFRNQSKKILDSLMGDQNLAWLREQYKGLPGYVQNTTDRLRQDLLRTSRSAASSAIVSAAQAARRAGLTRGSRGAAASQAAAQAAGQAGSSIGQALATGSNAALAAMPQALQGAQSFLVPNSAYGQGMVLQQLLGQLGNTALGGIASTVASSQANPGVGNFLSGLGSVMGGAK